MEIHVSCSCGRRFRARESLAGKTVACPGCKSPITVPAGGDSAPSGIPPPPIQPAAQPSEIIVGCGCGQQFKVEAKYAGQQVNCPRCQTLCVIPSPGQSSAPGAPQPTPVQQPGMPPAGMQLPGMHSPGYPAQPGYQQPPGYPQPGMHPPAYQQPSYDQPGYNAGYSMGGSYRKPTYKTGLGIFIFAIAASVYAGGFGLQIGAEAITEIRFMIARASGPTDFESIRNRSVESIRAEAAAARTLGNIVKAMLKIGGIAIMLGFVAIVVASVFSMMSPPPMFGIGIAQICVAATAAILLLIFDVIPLLRDQGVFGYSYYNLMTGDVFMPLLVIWSVIATFLLYSIFMMKAAGAKRDRAMADSCFYAMIGFSISAGIHLFLTIMMSLGITDEWIIYFIAIVRWLAHAAMIVGLVFLIQNLYAAKRLYRI